MAKAKQNVLNVEIRIISSKSYQNSQETTIKEPSLEDHGVIATKMKKKEQRTKNVSWLKHLMSHHFVSSTSAHHNRGSLSYQGDDDKDDGASHASTLSPTTYLNSLGPLDYQPYNIPTSSEQNDDLLFERETDLLNQTQQMHKKLKGGFMSFGKAMRGVFSKKKNQNDTWHAGIGQPLPRVVTRVGSRCRRRHRSTMVNHHQSTVVNGSGQRMPTTVNEGGPPSNHRRNSGLAGSTTGSGRVGSWFRSGFHVAPPE
nr:hypothetical protein [Tanacetum cinerariifolium]